jgi:hypothetical protein
MSYVLQFWEAPVARSIDEAVAAIDAPSPAQAGRFEAFAGDLRRLYPDAHLLEESGGELEASIWSDSPLTGRTDRDVLNLGLRSDCVNPKLLFHIAHLAADHGLQMLDPQAALLFRTDRTAVSRSGLPLRFLPRPQRPVVAAAAAKSVLSEQEVRHALLDRFIETYAGQGWALATDGDNQRIRKARRVRGDVVQFVEFSVQERSGEFAITARLDFSHPAIAPFLQEHAPEEAAEFLRRKGWCPQVHAEYGDWIAGILPPDALVGIYDERERKYLFSTLARVSDRRGVAAFEDAFMDWFKRGASLALDQVVNLPSLANFLDTPAHIDWRSRSGSWYLPWFSLLAIAWLGSAPSLEQWIKAARSRTLATNTSNPQNWAHLAALCDAIDTPRR